MFKDAFHSKMYINVLVTDLTAVLNLLYIFGLYPNIGVFRAIKDFGSMQTPSNHKALADPK
jgi:hypothetical protein